MELYIIKSGNTLFLVSALDRVAAENLIQPLDFIESWASYNDFSVCVSDNTRNIKNEWIADICRISNISPKTACELIDNIDWNLIPNEKPEILASINIS